MKIKFVPHRGFAITVDKVQTFVSVYSPESLKGFIVTYPHKTLLSGWWTEGGAWKHISQRFKGEITILKKNMMVWWFGLLFWYPAEVLEKRTILIYFLLQDKSQDEVLGAYGYTARKKSQVIVFCSLVSLTSASSDNVLLLSPLSNTLIVWFFHLIFVLWFYFSCWGLEVDVRKSCGKNSY